MWSVFDRKLLQQLKFEYLQETFSYDKEFFLLLKLDKALVSCYVVTLLQWSAGLYIEVFPDMWLVMKTWTFLTMPLLCELLCSSGERMSPPY